MLGLIGQGLGRGLGLPAAGALPAALPCLKFASVGYSASSGALSQAPASRNTKQQKADSNDHGSTTTPEHRRSRFEEYYKSVLCRELLLKTNVRHFMELPKLKRVDLTIQSKEVLGKAFAEKWQMLLHGLGLEYITGLKPYFAQQHGKQFRGGNVAAARVTLRGQRMYGFLEKISMLALPNQVGFAGFSAKAIDSQGNLHFKLGNLLNFPDYEENFDLFEDLKSMHVTVVLENSSAEKTAMLLNGMHIPFVVHNQEDR